MENKEVRVFGRKKDAGFIFFSPKQCSTVNNRHGVYNQLSTNES